MAPWKRYFPLAFAIVFAGLSSVSVFHFLKNREGVSRAEPIGMPSVVIAKNPIAMGEKITEKDLGLTQWPDPAAPERSFRTTHSVVGRTCKLDISANEPVLATQLLEEGENLASLIPPGMRAITVPVKYSETLAQILDKGSLVDVLALYMFQDTGVITAGVVVEKARVISVRKDGASAQNSLKPEQRGGPMMDVMVLVTPEEARGIVAAMGQGDIQLAVRNE